MKNFDYNQLMYKQGNLDEMKNTEREKCCADMVQSWIKELEEALRKHRELHGLEIESVN